MITRRVFATSRPDPFLRWVEQELKLVTKEMNKEIDRMLGIEDPYPVHESAMTAEQMELLLLRVLQGTLHTQAAMAQISDALHTAWQSGYDHGVTEILDT